MHQQDFSLDGLLQQIHKTFDADDWCFAEITTEPNNMYHNALIVQQYRVKAIKLYVWLNNQKLLPAYIWNENWKKQQSMQRTSLW